MALPGTIVLRPTNEFTQPDYSIVYKDPDGRALGVSRIYRDTSGTVGGATPWFWTMEHHQRQGRAEPHQGRCDSLDEAKAAWRRCRDSADMPLHWPPSTRRAIRSRAFQVSRSKVRRLPTVSFPVLFAGQRATC